MLVLHTCIADSLHMFTLVPFISQHFPSNSSLEARWLMSLEATQRPVHHRIGQLQIPNHQLSLSVTLREHPTTGVHMGT